MRATNAIKLGSKEINSLNFWFKAKNPLIVIINFVLIFISRFIPSIAFKRMLLRLTGMKIEKNVAIAYNVMFDFFFPELIELKENCIIGYNATILAHEFLQQELRIGKVSIGKNVLIGANSTIMPGIKIGDNAVISAMSLVNKDVKENAFVGGIPAQEISLK